MNDPRCWICRVLNPVKQKPGYTLLFVGRNENWIIESYGCISGFIGRKIFSFRIRYMKWTLN